MQFGGANGFFRGSSCFVKNWRKLKHFFKKGELFVGIITLKSLKTLEDIRYITGIKKAIRGDFLGTAGTGIITL
jgi:hypothetical protein